MPRPHKAGLDYFPLDVDVDQNDKIALIEAEFGLPGFAVVVKLFMKIYQQGYCYDWNCKTRILFSSKLKMDVKILDNIVEKCVEWDLFDDDKFRDCRILTSLGIQTRYLEATTRRKSVKIDKKHLMSGIDTDNYSNLRAVNVNINPRSPGVNVDTNPISAGINDGIGTQSKGKESKGKKQKKLFPADSAEMRLSKFLFDSMRKLNPDCKEPNFQVWAKGMDLLMRIDKRQEGDIEFIITMAHSSDFWCKNILSPGKLRIQFDRLTLEFKGKNVPNHTSDKYSHVG